MKKIHTENTATSNPEGKTLGILVSSDRHLDYLLGIAAAAHAKGKTVEIFFSGRGASLILKPAIWELSGKAILWACSESCLSLGIRQQDLPEGLPVFFADGEKNAGIMKKSDRYLVL